MHPDDIITATLLNTSPLPLRGYAYRIIDDQYRADPLSGIGSLQKGGRYNAPGQFEVLYSSDSRITALYEVGALFGDMEHPHSPELLLSLEVDLRRVLFLTEPVLQEKLGVESLDLIAPYLQHQLRTGESPTQRLGRLLYETQRFSALQVPSAAKEGAVNLVIFPAMLAADEMVRLHDPSGRWRQIRVGESA